MAEGAWTLEKSFANFMQRDAALQNPSVIGNARQPLRREKQMNTASRTLAWVCATFVAPALVTAASNPKAAIPAGTKIDVQLITTLSSSANKSGDVFTAEVEDPIFAGGAQVVPAGSTLRGHVTLVKPPGRVKGKAEMRLVADGITTKDGHEFDFAGQLGSNDASGVKVKDSEGTLEGQGKSGKQAAKDSGIGAAAGAAGGVLIDGGQGALYGAGIGALAGVIRVLAKHHKDIVLQSGTRLTFVLTSAATEGKAAAPSKEASQPFVCPTCN